MFCYSEFHFYFTLKVKTIKTITILSILLYDCKCEIQHFFKIIYKCSQVSTKSPVSAWIRANGTAEFVVNGSIVSEVIFTGYRTCSRIELTLGCICTVDSCWIRVNFLPPRCCTLSTLMTTDVDEFHLFTHPITQERHDIKISKVGSCVIFVVNTMCRETACYSPVTGLWFKPSHLWQRHSVHAPVGCFFVHWCICLQRMSSYLFHSSVFKSKWLN